MTAPYERYAGIYDHIGQTRFGTAMAQVTLDWLSERNVRPTLVLDLASGTGAATLAFARTGITATGLDRSPEMLNRLSSTAQHEHLPVELILGDMRTFALPRTFDLVTCFFDSINYLLTADDLLSAFTAVERALVPGGWYVFDVNTLDRYERAWNNVTELAFQDDFNYVIYRSTFDPATGLSPLTLTAFQRDQNQPEVWHRWDETHIERGYPLADLVQILSIAGLHCIDIAQLDERTMRLDGPTTERSSRAVFFVQKPHDETELAQ
jgi:SAM-dependent methyltransferase